MLWGWYLLYFATVIVNIVTYITLSLNTQTITNKIKRVKYFVIIIFETIIIYQYWMIICKPCGETLDSPLQLPCNHYIFMACVIELSDLDLRRYLL